MPFCRVLRRTRRDPVGGLHATVRVHDTRMLFQPTILSSISELYTQPRTRVRVYLSGHDQAELISPLVKQPVDGWEDFCAAIDSQSTIWRKEVVLDVDEEESCLHGKHLLTVVIIYG